MASKILRGGKILPGPKGWPLIGTLGELIAAGGAQNLHEYVDKRHRQFGPIYKEKIGPVTGVFISDPEYMRKVFAMEGRHPHHIIPESWILYNQTFGQKRGLLFMEGDEWYKYRKLLNKIILRPETGAIERAVSVVADDLLNTWKTTGRPNNIEKQLYTWSLQNIVSILLGADSYMKSKSIISETLDNLSKSLHTIFIESSNLSLIPAEFAKNWNLPPWKRFVTAVDNVFKTAHVMMEQLNHINMDENSILQQLKTSGMGAEDLNRIVIDLILAAGDTTAYTTQWCLYLLSANPAIQEDLFQEVRESGDCHLIRGALRETLRLYPVAPFVTRYMPDDGEVDGYRLNKGDLVIMSLYTSGREEQSFPDPLTFQPDRWTRVGNSYKNVVNAQGSLPFAMGARSCIGRKIAEQQITTTVAKVIEAFTISSNRKDVKIKLNLIAVPKEPITMTFQKRTDLTN